MNWIIRVYSQTLYENNINNVHKYLKNNKIVVNQCLYSNYGQCYFLEVLPFNHNVKHVDVIQKNASTFDWSAY